MSLGLQSLTPSVRLEDSPLATTLALQMERVPSEPAKPEPTPRGLADLPVREGDL